jgi:hypothetical protein
MYYHPQNFRAGISDGMARLQVADEGDGLQIWRIATDILNKQSWTIENCDISI